MHPCGYIRIIANEIDFGSGVEYLLECQTEDEYVLGVMFLLKIFAKIG